MPTEKEKMLAGDLYVPYDRELTQDRDKAALLQKEFNDTVDDKERYRVAKRLFGRIGKDSSVRPNVRCDYGYNIFLGDKVDINFDTTFLDVGKITVGDRTYFGPGVHIYAVGHPLDSVERLSHQEFGQDVKIGDDCWIGGRVTICPGVTIGNGVTIGAGSLVTKDIPDNVLAFGSPAKVIKSV